MWTCVKFECCVCEGWSGWTSPGRVSVDVSRRESGGVVLHSMWGDACCLAERGSKAPGSKYLSRKFPVWVHWCYSLLPVWVRDWMPARDLTPVWVHWCYSWVNRDGNGPIRIFPSAFKALYTSFTTHQIRACAFTVCTSRCKQEYVSADCCSATAQKVIGKSLIHPFWSQVKAVTVGLMAYFWSVMMTGTYEEGSSSCRRSLCVGDIHFGVWSR